MEFIYSCGGIGGGGCRKTGGTWPTDVDNAVAAIAASAVAGGYLKHCTLWIHTLAELNDVQWNKCMDVQIDRQAQCSFV